MAQPKVSIWMFFFLLQRLLDINWTLKSYKYPLGILSLSVLPAFNNELVYIIVINIPYVHWLKTLATIQKLYRINVGAWSNMLS